MTQLRWMVLAALAACVDAPVDEPDVIAAKKTDCGDLICGNAAQLGAHRWWELDASKTSYSPSGHVKIVDFRLANNTVLTPVVQNARLIGVGPDGTQYSTPAQLQNSHLWIDSDTSEHYILTLDSMSAVPFPMGGAQPGVTIPTYAWSYTQIGVNPTPPLTPVCSGAKIHHAWKDAILFTGDRYDGTTATVKTTGNTQPWFNFACTDDVLWKEFLFRYTDASSGAAPFMTTVAARNTAIAAIHADYCGTNMPYTETGTAVSWENRDGWLWRDPAHTQLEAIWANGRAVCLRNPRLFARSEVNCGGLGPPPPCTTDQLRSWKTFAEMVTWVP